ncbi:hypothetical protein [Mesorhizobium sp.]|uniref:hypothetical protein n=1 Tax=Mesorhizobium sp. TaxID=1871066 RepID=UPI000FEA82D0|nr:hypothetical protein [Mesorhizobium sp.]RWJ99551.1 MAG: hypothetical protein EOR39_32360 [Mesorhizobium sp.]TIQ42360.1 MAG: hypothetical protein E5X47_32015 [Mesorhizobium sp.]TIQ53163.1 MAG: hypothetical protein E5X46_32015 [Mesorhizobium sp.]
MIFAGIEGSWWIGIARANIAHFEDLLARETDPEKRRVIEALLARERQRLDIAERQADVVQ